LFIDIRFYINNHLIDIMRSAIDMKYYNYYYRECNKDNRINFKDNQYEKYLI